MMGGASGRDVGAGGGAGWPRLGPSTRIFALGRGISGSWNEEGSNRGPSARKSCKFSFGACATPCSSSSSYEAVTGDFTSLIKLSNRILDRPVVAEFVIRLNADLIAATGLAGVDVVSSVGLWLS